jgi:kynureninase
LAPLIGAQPHEVMIADSTSVNLFKLLAAALALRPDRRTVLTDRENFPTDLYVADGLAAWLGNGLRLKAVPASEVASAIDGDTAVLLLTQVDFRSGRTYDIAAITAAAHAAGALALWDLSHSVGVMPIGLDAAGADFAIGCGYKYLNGGPGAPAFLYVAESWLERVRSPIAGWMGHAEPFAFEPTYRPAAGIDRFRAGTPPILSLAALETALDALADVEIATVRQKSLAMTELFMTLVAEHPATASFRCLTPRAAADRGSQVSLSHPEGYAIVQALIARGVIGDFRAPDVLRFGFAPVYLRYVDVWDAVQTLADVMTTQAWRAPAFRRRALVT